MNVWIFDPSERQFYGKFARELDDIPNLLSTNRNSCEIWNLVLKRDDGDGGDIHVYMGYCATSKSYINFQATRILVDLQLFESISGLLNRADDNLLNFAIRGRVAFYCVGSSSSDLLLYSWGQFKRDWVLFFRSGTKPYNILEEKCQHILTLWLQKSDVGKIAKLLGIKQVQASTRDFITGTILAVMLRRLDGDLWEMIKL